MAMVVVLVVVEVIEDMIETTMMYNDRSGGNVASQSISTTPFTSRDPPRSKKSGSAAEAVAFEYDKCRVVCLVRVVCVACRAVFDEIC